MIFGRNLARIRRMMTFGLNRADPTPVAPEMDANEIRERLLTLAQGDILPTVRGIDRILHSIYDPGSSAIETPLGVAIVSQTCDIVRMSPDRSEIQVAPIERLDEPKLSAARDGRMPRFVPVPGGGGNAFVDLDHIVSVPKVDLAQYESVTGCRSDAERRALGQAIGRKFSRFPFPDEVSEQIARLIKSVRDKYDRPSSSIGRVLRRVMEVRLEAESTWSDPDSEIRLIVVCNPREIPTFEEPPELPPQLRGQLRLDPSGTSVLPSSRLAEMLENAYEDGDRTRVYFLWQALVDSWADQCNRVTPKTGTGNPHRFVGEFLEAGEFSLVRVRASEILDVDNLSTPWPE